MSLSFRTAERTTAQLQRLAASGNSREAAEAKAELQRRLHAALRAN